MVPVLPLRRLAVLGLLVALACAGPACSAREALPVGVAAPEIEGEDLDGVAFNLSDYRGKVVLLEFWGNWCGPCRGMYSHTREFMERYADEPFEVVGVNSDTQLERLRLVIEKQKLGWRSFWDGPKGEKGPISRAWGVDQWPTVCLIDGKGVIRNRWEVMDVPAIDAAIQKLLGRVDAKQAQAR
jgi:thiol-disulfide isomerase/thioredoxin